MRTTEILASPLLWLAVACGGSTTQGADTTGPDVPVAFDELWDYGDQRAEAIAGGGL